MPRRGDRAAPPARRDEWTLIFADNSAASGWEDLCAQAPGPMLEAWSHLSRDPRDRRANPGRVNRLRGDLGTRHLGGKALEQWQYEVTGAGRIWYCLDEARHIAHITLASSGHPAATDRS